VKRPWAEMNTFERSVFVAEKILGAHHDPRFPGDVVGYWVFPNGDRLLSGEIPDYADDHNAARLVEDEIERRGLQEEYIKALTRQLDLNVFVASASGDYRAFEFHPDEAWAFLHAAPEKRCRAALQAIGAVL
jgi:hypothetical protein